MFGGRHIVYERWAYSLHTIAFIEPRNSSNKASHFVCNELYYGNRVNFTVSFIILQLIDVVLVPICTAFSVAKASVCVGICEVAAFSPSFARLNLICRLVECRKIAYFVVKKMRKLLIFMTKLKWKWMHDTHRLYYYWPAIHWIVIRGSHIMQNTEYSTSLHVLESVDERSRWAVDGAIQSSLMEKSENGEKWTG